MRLLELILWGKIVVTGAAVALPCLLLPAKRLAAIYGIDSPAAAPLFRLYGVAVLALLFGYASALPTMARGEFPLLVVLMGLVSNGGAAALLFGTGTWRRAVPVTLFVTAIAALLAGALAAPDLALRRMW